MMIGLMIAATMLLAVMILSGLNTSAQIGPNDSSMALESSATKSATFAGTAFDLGAGFAPGGVGMPMAAKVDISAVEIDSGNETYAWVLTECDTESGSYTSCGPTLSQTAAAGTALTGVYAVAGFVSKRYVKLSLTIGGTIATGITYSAYLVPLNRP